MSRDKIVCDVCGAEQVWPAPPGARFGWVIRNYPYPKDNRTFCDGCVAKALDLAYDKAMS